MVYAKAEKMMQKYHMSAEGGSILVGLSGGADSVALLFFLRDYGKKHGISVSALHVEHGIRGEESIRDMNFVGELCRRLELPLQVVRVDVPAYAKAHGLGMEEAARILRHRELTKAAAGLGPDTPAALAHHLEDNCETILFSMMRGAGMRGMKGMEPVSLEDGCRLIRPFLDVTREEIEDDLRQRGQSYCLDSTNRDLTCSRNAIRRRLLPGMEAINPRAACHIHQSGRLLAEVWDYMEGQTEREFERLVALKRDASGNRKAEALSAELLQLHPALRGPLILKMMESVCGRRKDLAACHVEAVEKLLEAQSGKSCHLPYGMTARITFDRLILESGRSGRGTGKLPETPVMEAENRPLSGKIRTRTLDFDGNLLKIPKDRFTKWVDYDTIEGEFLVRTRKRGDYILMDAENHRKKLRKYFMEEKIPAEERDRIPLLCTGSSVIYVGGGRIGEAYRVTEGTKRLLEITYCGEED